MRENTQDNVETCISVSASTITKRDEEFITSVEIDPSKVRGIGTDGAATMIGCQNGVVKHLKQITPTAIGVLIGST